MNRSLASICTSGITGGHQQQGLVDFISQSLSGRNAACQNADWLNDRLRRIFRALRRS